MKLEIFSNEDRVYDPSVETKECEKNENVSNVNNVCFWNMIEQEFYNNWKCFPRSMKRLNGI